MVLKRTITRNIQNHAEVVIDYPPTGLVVFTGENSNGKSVIVKVTKALITGEFNKPRCRASLINRTAQFGEAIWIRDDDLTLTLHVAREASQTYVVLKYPDKEPVMRYLADKNYADLVREFGWHYDAENKITLNIAEADEALLFYKTSNKINGAVIRTATTDSIADKVVLQLEDVISSARKLRSETSTSVRTMQGTLAQLKVYPIEDLKDKLESGLKLKKILSSIYFPVLPKIKAIPKISIVDIYRPTVPKIRNPRVLNIACSIPDMSKLLQDINTLRNNRCPMCGRGLDCDC